MSVALSRLPEHRGAWSLQDKSGEWQESGMVMGPVKASEGSEVAADPRPLQALSVQSEEALSLQLALRTNITSASILLSPLREMQRFDLMLQAVVVRTAFTNALQGALATQRRWCCHLSELVRRQESVGQEEAEESVGQEEAEESVGQEEAGQMEIAAHYGQLLRQLDEQRQHGVLCDACIVVEGQVFKAHRNVLLASSRYFRTLYCGGRKGHTGTADPHATVTVTHLDIVTATGFRTILDFVYSARLALSGRNVIEVMSAASYLQMTDIVRACHSFIKAALDISVRAEAPPTTADDEAGPMDVAAVGGGAPEFGVGGMASEALVSLVTARSSSPWLPRRSSPANSSGDSAIASGPEGCGGPCGREDAWGTEFGPASNREGPSYPARHTGGSQPPPPGSGRRKNRKNKHTVRHITPQLEGNSEAGPRSPLDPTHNDGLEVPGAPATTVAPPCPDPKGEEPAESNSLQEALGRRSNLLEFTVIRKKFGCPCCSFSATHQCILKRHMRSHTGERPYPCTVCGKKFTRREHMKRHTQVHSKDKRYLCKVCSRVFLSAASVGIRHGSRRHGVCADCSVHGPDSLKSEDVYTKGAELMSEEVYTTRAELMSEEVYTTRAELMSEEVYTTRAELMSEEVYTTGAELMSEEVCTTESKLMSEEVYTTGAELMSEEVYTTESKLMSEEVYTTGAQLMSEEV
ncbi:hypothetical protein JZ751_009135 [Albula glossodonta]|uniref:Zinc finger and BTB domain-containing protein 46 n=1 Tax=Albula glossodonta TaxID=121402 RepID=A0A8T2MU62_9TELE|nr:hypothetical protein JZ751_009135 [Albula glossodonta]